MFVQRLEAKAWLPHVHLSPSLPLPQSSRRQNNAGWEGGEAVGACLSTKQGTPGYPSCVVQEVIVLDAAAARAATEETLLLHSIPHMMSKDLREQLGGGEQQQQAQQPEGGGE